jgi:flagellar basal-body rod protein FlgG
MSAQQLKVDTISNNLANVNTTGYKRGRVNFQELVYVTVPEWPGSNLGTQAPPQGAQAVPFGPATLKVGAGTRAIGVERLQTAGLLQSTGVETDLGLDGDGFFGIRTSSGETLYTRDGHFTFDAAGNLVTSAGESVVIEGGTRLPVGAKDLSVARDGTITATVSGQAQPSNFGRISLFRFGNPGGLEAMGQNLYQATEASGPAAAETGTGAGGAGGSGGTVTTPTKVRQEYLEASNVSLIDEMVGLMQAQRAYEMGAKIVQNADTLMAIANGLKR